MAKKKLNLKNTDSSILPINAATLEDAQQLLEIKVASLKTINAFEEFAEQFYAAVPFFLRFRDLYVKSFYLLYDVQEQYISPNTQKFLTANTLNYKSGLVYVQTMLKIQPDYSQCMPPALILAQALHIHTHALNQLNSANPDKKKNIAWLKLTYSHIMSKFCGFYQQFAQLGPMKIDLNNVIRQLEIASIPVTHLVPNLKKYLKILDEALKPLVAPMATREETVAMLGATVRRLENSNANGSYKTPDSRSFYKKIETKVLAEFYAYLKQHFEDFIPYATLEEAITASRWRNANRLEYIAVEQYYYFCNKKIADLDTSLLMLIGAENRLNKKLFWIKKSYLLKPFTIKFAEYSAIDFNFSAERSLLKLIKTVLGDLEYAPSVYQKVLLTPPLDNEVDEAWLFAKKGKFYQESLKTFALYRESIFSLYLKHFCYYLEGMIDPTVKQQIIPNNLEIPELNYLLLQRVFQAIFPLLLQNKKSQYLSQEEAYELLVCISQCLIKYSPQYFLEASTYEQIYGTIFLFIRNINDHYFLLYDNHPEVVTQVTQLLEQSLQMLKAIKPEDELVTRLLQLSNAWIFSEQFNQKVNEILRFCGEKPDDELYISKIFSFILTAAKRLNPEMQASQIPNEQVLSFCFGLGIYLEKLIHIVEKTLQSGPAEFERIDAITDLLGGVPLNFFPGEASKEWAIKFERINSLRNTNRAIRLQQIYTDIDKNLSHLKPIIQQLEAAQAIFLDYHKNEQDTFYQEACDRHCFYLAITQDMESSPPALSQLYQVLGLVPSLTRSENYRSSTSLDIARICQQKLSKIITLMKLHELKPHENYKKILFDAWLRLFLKKYTQFLFPIFQNLRKRTNASERASLKGIIENVLSSLDEFENHKTMAGFKRLSGFLSRISTFELVQKAHNPSEKSLRFIRVDQGAPPPLPPRKTRVKRRRESRRENSQPSTILQSLFHPQSSQDSLPLRAMEPVAPLPVPSIFDKPKKELKIVRFPCKTDVARSLPSIVSHFTYAEILKKNLPGPQSFVQPAQKVEKALVNQSLVKQYSAKQFRTLKQEIDLYFECFYSVERIYLQLNQRGQLLGGFAKIANQTINEMLCFYITIYSYQIAEIYRALVVAITERKTPFPSAKNQRLDSRLKEETKRYQGMINATKQIAFVIEKPHSFISFAMNMLIYYCAKLKQESGKDSDFIGKLHNEICGLQFHLRHFVREALNDKYLACELDIFLNGLGSPVQIFASPMSPREALERYYVLQLFDLHALAENSLYDLCIWSESIDEGLCLDELYGVQLKQDQQRLQGLITEAKNLGFNRHEAEKMLAFYRVLVPCFEITRELSLLTSSTPLSQLKALFYKGPQRAYQLIALNQEIERAGLFLDFHALLARLFSLNQELCRPIQQWLINASFIEWQDAPQFPLCAALMDMTIIKDKSLALGVSQSSLFSEKKEDSSVPCLERRCSF